MQDLLHTLAKELTERQWKLATAESCTGGGVAFSITRLAGSSDWFDRGFVTYSNASKSEMLGVPVAIIEHHGAVSAATAKAMAEGALQQSHAQLSVAITGIAGPSGGSVEKPVGTVWFGWSSVGADSITLMQQLQGNRDDIRQQAIQIALEGVVKYLKTIG